jgi:hypothetical protein
VLDKLSVSIAGGPDARLVNLSRGGAQLEVAGRLPLRSFVRLTLTRSAGEDIAVVGRVAWAKVAAVVSGQVFYRVAIVFDELLPDLARDESPQSTTAFGLPLTIDCVPEETARFPLAAAEFADDSALSERPSGLEEVHPQSADDADTHDLRGQVADLTENLARQSALNDTLTANLEESDAVMASLRSGWEEERRGLQEERATLAQQLTNALTRGDALQVALDTREQGYTQVLRDQRDKYEALIAELVRATNDQQTEYQKILDQLTAAQDEERRRAEGHEAELARLRVDIEQERAESESRQRQLQTRLEAAEALCAAHHARYEELRHTTGQLMDTLASPVQLDSNPGDDAALVCENSVFRKY